MWTEVDIWMLYKSSRCLVLVIYEKRFHGLFAFKLQTLSTWAWGLWKSYKFYFTKLVRIPVWISLEYKYRYCQWHYRIWCTHQLVMATYILSLIGDNCVIYSTSMLSLFNNYVEDSHFDHLPARSSQVFLFLRKLIVLTQEYYRLFRCICAHCWPSYRFATDTYRSRGAGVGSHLPWLGTGTWVEYIRWSDIDMSYLYIVHRPGGDLGLIEQVSNHGCCCILDRNPPCNRSCLVGRLESGRTMHPDVEWYQTVYLVNSLSSLKTSQAKDML